MRRLKLLNSPSFTCHFLLLLWETKLDVDYMSEIDLVVSCVVFWSSTLGFTFGRPQCLLEHHAVNRFDLPAIPNYKSRCLWVFLLQTSLKLNAERRTGRCLVAIFLYKMPFAISCSFIRYTWPSYLKWHWHTSKCMLHESAWSTDLMGLYIFTVGLPMSAGSVWSSANIMWRYQHRYIFWSMSTGFKFSVCEL